MDCIIERSTSNVSSTDKPFNIIRFTGRLWIKNQSTNNHSCGIKYHGTQTGPPTCSFSNEKYYTVDQTKENVLQEICKYKLSKIFVTSAVGPLPYTILQNVFESEISLLYNGLEITENDTPSCINMKDGDILERHREEFLEGGVPMVT
ncbi:hypothetical protein QTP88_028575 [Uroleucon formosanum]